MTKIIQIQDYLDADVALDLAKDLLQGNQDDLASENQQQLLEIMNLESSLETQALLGINLKSQVKELQVENEILLDALESHDLDDFVVTLTDTVKEPVNEIVKKDEPQQSAYWEKEYSVLKDKIRDMEQALKDKDHSFQNLHDQNEQLLNELLAKP